jgi:hypothetical protein
LASDQTPPAEELLPDGPRITFPLLERIGRLLNPQQYRGCTTWELVSIADELNAQVNVQLEAAARALGEADAPTADAGK